MKSHHVEQDLGTNMNSHKCHAISTVLAFLFLSGFVQARGSDVVGHSPLHPSERYLEGSLQKTASEEELLFDDGVFENAMGWSGLHGIAANGPFRPSHYPVTIDFARVAFNGVNAGDPFKVYIYVDTTGVWDRPSSSILVATAGPLSISTSGTFQDIDLRPLNLVMNSGRFFIGIQQSGSREMWILYDTNGAGKNASVDSDLDGVFTPLDKLNPPVQAVFAIRAVVSTKTTFVLEPPQNLHASQSSGHIALDWHAPANLKRTELAFDDEVFEMAMGWDNLQGIAANGPFQPSQYPVRLDKASVSFNGVQAGDPFKVHVYVDPGGAADRPSSNLSVGEIGPLTISHSGMFQDVDLKQLGVTLTSGTFFIGVQQLSAKEMWILYDENGAGKNAFVDSDLDGIFTPLNRLNPPVQAVFAIRAVVSVPNSGTQVVPKAIADSDNEKGRCYPGGAYEDLLGTVTVHREDSIAKNTPVAWTKDTHTASGIPILRRYRVYRSQHSPVSATEDNYLGSVCTSIRTYEDRSIQTGRNYYYAISALYDFGESDPSNEVFVSVTDVTAREATGSPASYHLFPNYPNPFNPETQIRYQLPKRADVQIAIYSISGQLMKTVLDESQPAGTYIARWDGTDEQGQHVASGVYLYALKAGEFVQVRKISLVR